jgi:HlyD family type I secretion membrane fusion protein
MARLLTDVTRETNVSPRSIILVGVGVLAIFCGSFALWAWLAPLHSAVITQGEVTFQGKRQAVQHLEGGIVKKILIKDGDTVKAGQPLILLEDDQVRPIVTMLEGQSATETAAMARLDAEKNDASTISFPKGLPASAIQTETKLFLARREAFQSQVEVLKSQLEQTREGIKGLQEQLISKGQEISALKEQLEANRSLLKDGYVTKTSVLELERMLAQKAGEREQISAGISSNKQRLAELNQRIISLKTERIQNAVAELKQSSVRRIELEERVRPSRDTLERQVIRAPVGGIVVGLKVTTIGGVVMPREPLMEIAPQSDDLYLEAKIMVNDISDLKIGQEAEVTLSAFKSSSTPPVKARLTYISADRLNMRTAQGDFPYYDAQLVFDKESLKLLGDQKLVPGMMAQITIATMPRTALDYFIAPLRDRMGKAFHAK